MFRVRGVGLGISLSAVAVFCTQHSPVAARGDITWNTTSSVLIQLTTEISG